MPAHEPEGTTTCPRPSNSSSTLRASACAEARSPELYAGCPQHVCSLGTTTSHPAASSSRIVAKPMRGRIRSTRQVTKRATRIIQCRVLREKCKVAPAMTRALDSALSTLHSSLLIEALLLQPALDHAGDLIAVAVHHDHVRVAAEADLGQVDDLVAATRLAHALEKLDAGGADLRPSR